MKKETANKLSGTSKPAHRQKKTKKQSWTHPDKKPLLTSSRFVPRSIASRTSLGLKAGCTLLKSTPTVRGKPAQLALPPSVRGPEVREHPCPECNYRTHRARAAAEMVWHRGLENLVAQGLWGTETACQVGLSGVIDLDKWRGAGISQSSRGCARAVLVESASAGCHAGVSSRPLNF
jgi:hypothetical protein